MWPPRASPFPMQMQMIPGFPPGTPQFQQQYAHPGMVNFAGVPPPIPVPMAAQMTEEMDPEERKNLFEMQVDAHFNMNSMLSQNILASDYFKSLYELKTVNEVIDEIWNEVDHLEPFAIGKTRLPSTSFCLLYKLFVMRITHNNLRSLLNYKKAPFVRGIGILFLRYVSPPEKLWDWLEPYLDDQEEFTPGGDKQKKKIGAFVRELLVEIKYYGTLFRRIPVTLAREIKKKNRNS